MPGGNGEPPGVGHVTENIAGQCEHRARVGGMSHELRCFVGFKFAKLDFFRRVHGGIHKDDDAGLRNRVGKFGGEHRAGERADARQVQGGHGVGHTRADAIVGAQRVAVADDQKTGGSIWRVPLVHRFRLLTIVRLANVITAQFAILIAASFFKVAMSFDDFTSSRTPVPSGYFGASLIVLRMRLGSLASCAASTALSPRMNATRKQPGHGASHTIVRSLRLTRSDHPALSEYAFHSWTFAPQSWARSARSLSQVALAGPRAAASSGSVGCFGLFMNAFGDIRNRCRLPNRVNEPRPIRA